MLILRNGDLLNNDDKLHAIAHGCNCFGHMGAGVAKFISQKYPEAYKRDKLTPVGDKEKLGSFSYTFDETDKLFIGNLYTQFTHWDQNDMFYDWALHESLKRFIFFIHKQKDEDVFRIGIPMIGCGLANGKPSNVYSTLREVDQYFASRNIRVDIYLYLIDPPMMKLLELIHRGYEAWRDFSTQNTAEILNKKKQSAFSMLAADLINTAIEENKYGQSDNIRPSIVVSKTS